MDQDILFTSQLFYFMNECRLTFSECIFMRCLLHEEASCPVLFMLLGVILLVFHGFMSHNTFFILSLLSSLIQLRLTNLFFSLPLVIYFFNQALSVSQNQLQLSLTLVKSFALPKPLAELHYTLTTAKTTKLLCYILVSARCCFLSSDKR